jgi:hypothetical protein
MKSIIIWSALVQLIWLNGGASAETSKQIAVNQPILSDDGTVAEDISGIACLAQNGSSRTCLIINDEDRSGQFVKVGSDGITPTSRVDLITAATEKSAFGSAPTNPACSDKKPSFKDLDGEAVAYDPANNYFYVAGSHGCSRKKGKFRTSSFLLVRVPVNAAGEVAKPIEATYRLSDVLRQGSLSPYFSQPLREQAGTDGEDKSGLNVEGLAIQGPKLYAGLRAPLIDGKAVIAVAYVDELFKEGAAPIGGTMIPPLSVPLGSHAGIRDIAALPDGRLLILSGPTLDQKVPSEIFVFDPNEPKSQPTRLAIVDDMPGKPEALLFLDQDQDKVRVVVMSDGPPNGSPREYLLPLKPASGPK